MEFLLKLVVCVIVACAALGGCSAVVPSVTSYQIGSAFGIAWTCGIIVWLLVGFYCAKLIKLW